MVQNIKIQVWSKLFQPILTMINQDQPRLNRINQDQLRMAFDIFPGSFIFNRPGVAGAVLQTASLLIN